MDETFAFTAPVMPKRAIHPVAIRAAVIAFVFVAAIGALGMYVVEHEQAADARRDALAAQLATLEQAKIEEAAAEVAVPVDIEASVDLAARDAADEALGFAQAILGESGSLVGAGPASLATMGSPLVFVDGPSTAPSVVSVAVTDTAWAAAVAGPTGCAWIMLTSDGHIARDTGSECTGLAALAANGASW
jgi:hypothetical protein